MKKQSLCLTISTPFNALGGKKKEQESNKGLFQGWVPVGGHKEKVNEGEYILYSYMKIEE
jgi:hypothetical protein